MTKPQLKTEDSPTEPSAHAYAPKEYSAREHAAMGVKVVLFIGLLFGLLWLLDVVAAN